MIGLQLTLHIDRQEGFAGKHLRACTLKVVIDEFYLINLALGKLTPQLHSYLDTVVYIGMLGKGRILALHIQAHLACLLVHLATNGINLHIIATGGFGVLIHSMCHLLDDVGIATAAKRRVT